ncbi:S-adenosyl-L-methionine:benzoic acid/salicylic acid carboxyl methyltransferase 1-like [Capsicum annuum]|uniref:S-adenosyl-L-methionine:benzoic acid/salicylic acid carboxyl methyltransferase 1-like n=1 Tax=Capsicum annuum TaxID=4072 RepID=UPI001FB14887|nr:S-adenosyl-L-methionine:benzoic acid/salicylic acid carboxyl methyltransferase 1-like [Capsicum annuum]
MYQQYVSNVINLYHQRSNVGILGDFEKKFDSNCFAGSFYTRLFPSKSLHFGHSSYSLHWLSQVPDGIQNNEGTIYAGSTSPPSVHKAYYDQFEKDFATFLKHRSKELVKDGHMILTIPGRKNEQYYSKLGHYLLEPLARALKHLVVEGSIEEEKVDSFNFPVYYPSPREVMHIVEKEGSFTINVLETLEHHVDLDDAYGDEDCNSNPNGYNKAQCVRAFAEPLLLNHFRDDELLVDNVINKCREIYVNCMTKEDAMFTSVVVSLTKK